MTINEALREQIAALYWNGCMKKDNDAIEFGLAVARLARKDALEEAIKLCKKSFNPDSCHNCHEHCAAAIRTMLAEDEKQEEKTV